MQNNVEESKLIRKVNKDGRVTIPKSIRDHLGLKPGDELDYQLEDDIIVLYKNTESVDLGSEVPPR